MPSHTKAVGPEVGQFDRVTPQCAIPADGFISTSVGNIDSVIESIDDTFPPACLLQYMCYEFGAESLVFHVPKCHVIVWIAKIPKSYFSTFLRAAQHIGCPKDLLISTEVFY